MHELLVICDGDEKSGYGHLNRCLALAELVIEHDWDAKFIGKFSDTAKQMINSVRAHVALGDCIIETIGALTEIEPLMSDSKQTVVLLDSYRVGSQFMEGIANMNRVGRFIAFDDEAKHSHYPCSGIINFTMMARDLEYPQMDAAKYFGLNYFPARSWLRRLRSDRARSVRSDPNNYRIVVTLGGMDTKGHSLRIVKALAKEKIISEIVVVIDSRHRDNEEIDNVLATFSGIGKRLPLQESLLSVFKSCDVVVCSGGLTKYESLFLGLPTAVVNQTETQQQDTAYFETVNLVAVIDDEEGTRRSESQSLEQKLQRLFASPEWIDELSLHASECFTQSPEQAMSEILDLKPDDCHV